MGSSEQHRVTSEAPPSLTTKFTRPIVIVAGAVGVVLALIAVSLATAPPTRANLEPFEK